jgi:hypothetical protein
MLPVWTGEDEEPPKPERDRFGDTIAEYVEPALNRAVERFQDAGVIDVDEDDPRLLQALQRANDYAGDMAMAGVNVGEATWGAVAGAVGEAFGGSPERERRLAPERERRLARDVMGMPEAFAGTGFVRGANQLDDVVEGATDIAARGLRGLKRLGEGAAEAADGLLVPKADKGQKGIRAYHGSPSDFDEFSTDKINTGEGSQVYGRGLYFAENEDVARSYRNKLAERGSEPSPRMYEVNIDASSDDFLDWEAPLSEQPEKVRQAFLAAETRGGPMRSNLLGPIPRFSARQTGSHAYKTYVEDVAASGVGTGPRAEQIATQELRDAGILGVKYRDAHSRNTRNGTKNYVVFDDSIIEIVRKYGIAGAASILGISADEVKASIEGRNQDAPVEDTPEEDRPMDFNRGGLALSESRKVIKTKEGRDMAERVDREMEEMGLRQDGDVLVPSIADAEPTRTGPRENRFGDTIAKYTSGPLQEAWTRAMDAGQIDVDPDDPALITALKRANDYFGDMALAGLGVGEAGAKAVAASVGEVFGDVGGQGRSGEERLTEDLMAMPEAFAGAGISRGANMLDDVLDTGGDEQPKTGPINRAKFP